MKLLAKLIIPTAALILIGCGGGSNDPDDPAANEQILIANEATEVFDGDTYEARTEDAQMELTHHTDSDKRYVTLTQGEGVIIRKGSSQ